VGRAVETLQHETLWVLMSFGPSYPGAQALFKGMVVCLNALPLTDGDDSLGWDPQVDLKAWRGLKPPPWYSF